MATTKRGRRKNLTRYAEIGVNDLELVRSDIHRRPVVEIMKDLDLHAWFAGKALEGLLSNAHYPPQGSGEPMDQFVARVTDCAYRIADAMLKHGQKLKKEASAW